MIIDRDRLFKNFDQQNEYMEDKIQLGIESNRKGYARINFADENGEPALNVKIKINQISHDFKFGCNIFKLKGFETDAENNLYEEKFKKLFNLAVTPFYWSKFEPTEGNMRFEKDSEFIDRRPAPELVLEFCKENNIEVKGHPLYWAAMVPDWLPKDYEEMKPYLTRRLKKIAQRYDGVIKSFDCVNEVTSVPLLNDEPNKKSSHYRNFNPLGGDYTEWVFKQADRFFCDSKLIINETGGAWADFKKEVSPYYMLIEKLLNKGCRVDTIGLQYHIFLQNEDLYKATLKEYNPKYLYNVMDCYGGFNKPLCVSEITVPGCGENGDEVQAETLKNLYRIWFSHKNMESIVYWNLGDNCAISEGNGWGEDVFKSGLTRSDFSEKPSYKVLDELINKEWQTNLELESKTDFVNFKGFYGNYELSVTHNGKETKRQIHLSKTGYDEFTVVCK